MSKYIISTLLLFLTVLSACSSSFPKSIEEHLFIYDGISGLSSINTETGQTISWQLDVADDDIVDFRNGPNLAVAHDGRHVVYATRKQFRPWKVMLSDGKESKVIGSLEGLAWVQDLAWSYNDQEIAFLASFSDGYEHSTLAIMNTISGGIDYVTEPVLTFAWRPQSGEIVYSVADGAGMGIYLVDDKRENFRRLEHLEWGSHLTWSPNGADFIFAPFGEWRIVLFNVASRTRKEISSNSEWTEPYWSSDRENIVMADEYKLVYCETAARYQSTVKVLNLQSAQTKVIGKQSIFSAIISPDGKYIVYGGSDSCDKDSVSLIIVDQNSGQERVLKSNLSQDTRILAWR